MVQPIRQFWIIVLLLCVVLFLTAGRGEAADQNRFTVLIDAAHGGEDLGVISDRIREKDLTLKIALLLREEGRKEKHVRIELTRSADLNMSTAERHKAAENLKPDCVVSVHINAGFGKKATGYEVYFPGFPQTVPGGVDSAPILKDMAKNRNLNDAVRLAHRLQSSLDPLFPRKGRGLRDAPNALLDGLAVPGVILEIGFATHPADRKSLLDEEIQRAVAKAVMKGLRDYSQK
jgi:N-acetylmuramoyl-L-alanine amidase